MGLFIRQDENRSQLQERLAEELRERAKTSATGSEPIDQSTDSNYLKDTERTSDKAWLWLAIVGIAIVSFVLYLIVR